MWIHSRFWQELENLGDRILQKLPLDSWPVASFSQTSLAMVLAVVLYAVNLHQLWGTKGTKALVLLRRTVAFFLPLHLQTKLSLWPMQFVVTFSWSALHSHICFRHQFKEGEVDFLDVKYFICDLLSVIAINVECLPWRITKNTVK